MYSEWNVIDETEGMDDYSTVVHAEGYPPTDWPNILGFKETGEKDCWTVVWLHNSSGKELVLFSDRAFRCPTPDCSGRILFGQDECYHCNWPTPESFKGLRISLNWDLYMMDQAFMTSAVPVTARLDMLDAVRWADEGDFNSACGMLLEHLARNDTDPHSLAAFYGPVLRVVNSQKVSTKIIQMDSLTVDHLVAEVQELITFMDEAGEYGLMAKLCQVLGQLVLKDIHWYADTGPGTVALDATREVCLLAIAQTSERPMGNFIESGVQEGLLWKFTLTS